MTLEEVIRTSPIVVHPGRYTYLKCNEIPTDNASHFMISRDNDEITVVTSEENMTSVPHAASEGWFKLIEVRVSQPFVAKAFLATITKTIAEGNMSILVVSTFSKDYLLLRESTYLRAIDALKGIGFPIAVNGV
jgi:hypothetical protein